MEWNITLFTWLYGFAHQSVFLDAAIHFTADTLPVVVVLGVAWYLADHHAHHHALWELAVFFGLSFVVVGIIFLLKDVLALSLPPRPFDVLPNIIPLVSTDGLIAFPSAHTAFFATLGAAMIVSHRKSGIFILLLTLLIGVARVMAGVHWPIDIIGGFLLGGAVGFFTTRFMYHWLCRVLKVCIIPVT